jgi:hypothetical protein
MLDGRIYIADQKHIYLPQYEVELFAHLAYVEVTPHYQVHNGHPQLLLPRLWPLSVSYEQDHQLLQCI